MCTTHENMMLKTVQYPMSETRAEYLFEISKVIYFFLFVCALRASVVFLFMFAAVGCFFCFFHYAQPLLYLRACVCLWILLFETYSFKFKYSEISLTSGLHFHYMYIEYWLPFFDFTLAILFLFPTQISYCQAIRSA